MSILLAAVPRQVLLFKQKFAKSVKDVCLSQLPRSDSVTDVSAAPGIWQNGCPRVSHPSLFLPRVSYAETQCFSVPSCRIGRRLHDPLCHQCLVGRQTGSRAR